MGRRHACQSNLNTFAYEKTIGYDAKLLSSEDLARSTFGIEPRHIPRQGAIYNPGEGWVDLPKLIEVLLSEFATLGGILLTDVGKAIPRAITGKVGGVTTTNQHELGADVLVLATGPAVPGMAADLGQAIGDDTPIALLVKTKSLILPLKAVFNTRRVDVRPTPDNAFALDAGWAER